MLGLCYLQIFCPASMRSRSLRPAVASCCWVATAGCTNFQVHVAFSGKNKVCHPVMIDQEKLAFSSIWRRDLSPKRWLSADKRWTIKAWSVLKGKKLLSIKILKETINALQIDPHLLLSPMVHLLLTQLGVLVADHGGIHHGLSTCQLQKLRWCVFPSPSQHLSFITIPAISSHHVTTA